MPSARAGRRASPLWLVGPLVAGTALRIVQLRDQVLGGDELHTLRAALTLPLGEILVTYQRGDHSIPLTFFYRVLAELGIPLSELVVRAPVLACGIALVAVVPLTLERCIGRAPATLLAWMLALSPALVLYSRIVRSYAPVALLGFAAVAAFYAWLQTGSRRHAALYVGCAVLAVYLHLGAGPFVLAPLLFAAASGVLGSRGGRPRPADLALVAGCVALGLASFLLPALESLLRIVPLVRQERSVEWATFVGVAKLQAGTPQLLLVALFLAAVARGIASQMRTRTRLAAYGATLVGAQALGLLVLSPVQLHQPLMFGRYLLIALPVVLTFAALGLATPWWRGPGRLARTAPAVAAYGLLAALALSGPFADRHFWTSPFAHHNDYVGFHRSRGTLDESDVPAFYRSLRGEDSAAPLIEYPWNTWWNYSRAPNLYQRLHGRRVIVSAWESDLYDARLALRNVVEPSASSFLESPARYVIVHRDPGAEEDRVREAPRSLASELDPELTRVMREEARSFGSRMRTYLEREWGAPDYVDESIWVWNLDRVRASGAAAPLRDAPR